MALDLTPCGNCRHPEQAHNQACNVQRPGRSGFRSQCSCSRFVPPTEPAQEAA